MGSPAGSSSSISITGGRATFRHGTGSTPTPSPRPRLVKSNTSSPASSTTNNNNGRFMSISRDENDAAGEVTSEFNPSYTVHIPPTPDHHLNLSSAAPLHPRNPNTPVPGKSAAGNGKGKLEQQEQQQQLQQEEEKFLSSVLFTGGFDSVTRGHVMEKGMEDDGAGDSSNRQTPISSSFTSRGRAVCSIRGCDAKSLDLIPCECRYRICRDCYIDALDAKGARCPGCKEPYKIVDPEDEHLPLPPAPTVSECRAERRLSLLGTMKSSKSTTQLLMSNHGGDFDHTGWLYGTKGTYGYGNALWPKDGAYIGTGGIHGSGGNPSVLNERSRKPLSRKISISPAVLNPYRLLVLIRLAALVMFLMWRIKRPNRDAMWLWGMSVVCEMWFAFSWILDQLPKLNPVNRTADLNMLRERFEMPSVENPRGRSDLPGVDVFVSTADAEKEPPLVTANTILSILAAEYPVDKTAVYLSDDAGSLLSFEALAEAGSFARIWVPFCRKHSIEPRNPESYFQLRGDPTKNKVRPDFVKDRRRVKREYDEFKVRINGLPDSIRRRSGAYNAHEEMRAKRSQVESGGDVGEPSRALKATWMSDGTHWPGTWTSSEKDHARGDHAGIIQVMLAPPGSEQMLGNNDEDNLLDTTDVDIRLPMLVYVSREKRPGYDHNKKAGAMNALVRTSAVMSNGAFVLNLDCDHYINNSMALREAMCFLMDRGGDRVCFVQFPQRFEGVDPNDRYANHNTVFFDVNMRALDGLQGPMYVGTGCVFRRFAIYGFDPPRVTEHGSYGGCCGSKRKFFLKRKGGKGGRMSSDEDEDEVESQLLPKKFGNSAMLLASIPVAEFQGRPLAEQAGVKNGRPAGALTLPREPLDSATVAEAINVISCWYEDKTEWGQNVGWIYGSVTEDVVTGYRMHNKGWKSVYCVTSRDAFRGTAPINLTDRLHQVLRWATGSVEIFFSRNNAIFGSSRLKLLQRIAYMNVGIYPFTSIFLTVYCFLPALSLFTGHFIVQSVSISFLVLLLIITVTLCMLAVLEIKWSGITLEEWWRNEQFWLIGGTSAHMAAVLQGLLKVIAGVDISFTLTAKASSGDENEDDYAELYEVRWSALMIPPITIMMINIIAIIVGVARTIYSPFPQWTTLIGSAFFSMWVLFHLYPFAKGLMGRKRRTPTIIYVWSGLLAIVISLLWVSISNPLPSNNSNAIQGFQFP